MTVPVADQVRVGTSDAEAAYARLRDPDGNGLVHLEETAPIKEDV